MITAQLVKQLRDQTGAGMMDCKKALSETDGDLEKAVEWLQVKGMAAAAKKAARVAAEGLVQEWISADGKEAVLVEINCETDFVTRNEQFQNLVVEIANAVGPTAATTVEEALALNVGGKSLEKVITDAVSTIGENIRLRRVARIKADGMVASYMHAGNQIGVLVALQGDNESFARDVAMHIAAMNPAVLSPEEIDADTAAKQQEIFTQIVIEEGKPENIVPRIVEGKMQKWRRDVSLRDQAFVKNPDLTVAQYEKETGGVTLTGFVRLQVGEGIEKEEKSLADEVAATLKG
ncbi:MAG: translation elongation factor Ts [bacterium]